MTDEQSALLMSLLLHNKEDCDRLAKARQQTSQEALCGAIFDDRLAEGVVITDTAWFFVVAQCHTPGDAVMFAYTISLISWLQFGAEVTLDMLITQEAIFGWGVPELHGPSEDGLRVWDAQKRRNRRPSASGALLSDNWLDDPEFWDANRENLWGSGISAIPKPQTIHI
jgi:hypothetical protein